MQRLRLSGLPPLSAISDFHEINIRTYLKANDKPGVYFLTIEAEKWLSVWTAKLLSGLPYEKAAIHRNQDGNRQVYRSKNKTRGSSLHASFEVGHPAGNKTALDAWLTERYYLYLNKKIRFTGMKFTTMHGNCMM